MALTPSFHGRLVADCPNLQKITFAAANEGSELAQSMVALVRRYASAAGTHALYRSPFILNDQAVCLLAFEVVTWPQTGVAEALPMLFCKLRPSLEAGFSSSR